MDIINTKPAFANTILRKTSNTIYS